MTAYLMAFESTHAAMASEATLGRDNVRMVPVPRAISAGCGIALVFEAETDADAHATASRCHEAQGLASLYEKKSRSEYRLVCAL